MKTWTKPLAEVEQFMANEYVAAACGDQWTVYKFKCNAGSEYSSYHVYLNGPDGIAHTADDVDWSARSGRLKTYSPCGATHEASTKEDFPAGYMYRYRNGSNTGDPINVIVWTENGSNTHCTTDLDMNKWETAKS